jgi:MerR family transcriptional regulator, thiopeptide resistance regulator
MNVYSVGQFARISGVSVRTLHFYDEVGLLKATRREYSQHRQYQQSDLLRLQQILVLKQLGFSLQEIKISLSNPKYDIYTALKDQRDMLAYQIQRLQATHFAMSRTLESFESGDQVDWDQVAKIIHNLTDQARQDWMQDKFPSEDWEWIHERATQMPSTYVTNSVRAWENVYEDFNKHRDLAPDHPDVQALAGQVVKMVEMFTQGKAEITEVLSKQYEDVSKIPELYRMPHQDQALQDFMKQAVTIYQEYNKSTKREK